MSGLTTADLDEMALGHGPNQAEYGGLACPGHDPSEPWPCAESRLIAAARLQVALDELPLPEGWSLWAIVRQRSAHHGDRFRATAGTEEGWPERAGIENKWWAYGPTMLAAVLQLDVALRSRA